MGGTSGAAGTKSRLKKKASHAQRGFTSWDAHGEGPKYKFREDPHKGSESRIGRHAENFFDKIRFGLPEGANLGGTQIEYDPYLDAREEQGALIVAMSGTQPDLRKGGWGMGRYLAALGYAGNEGKPFWSDTSVSEEASRVWFRLKAAGVDVRVYGDGDTSFGDSGYTFRIPAWETKKWGSNRKSLERLESRVREVEFEEPVKGYVWGT